MKAIKTADDAVLVWTRYVAGVRAVADAYTRYQQAAQAHVLAGNAVPEDVDDVFVATVRASLPVNVRPPAP